MSFLPIHLSPSGAEIYYSGAYANATGATGAGGEYASTASAQGWNTVTFKNAAVRVGIGSALPTGSDITTSVNFSLAPAVIIGGATPIGDVRGEGTGYVPPLLLSLHKSNPCPTKFRYCAPRTWFLIEPFRPLYRHIHIIPNGSVLEFNFHTLRQRVIPLRCHHGGL